MIFIILPNINRALGILLLYVAVSSDVDGVVTRYDKSLQNIKVSLCNYSSIFHSWILILFILLCFLLSFRLLQLLKVLQYVVIYVL